MGKEFESAQKTLIFFFTVNVSQEVIYPISYCFLSAQCLILFRLLQHASGVSSTLQTL